VSRIRSGSRATAPTGFTFDGPVPASPEFEEALKKSYGEPLPLDQMLEKMGFGMADGKHIEDIRAPMPGLVLHVSVTEGQEIKDGEPVLVLEAMKMENSIILHGDAKIKKILVKTGQSVEKGQVLVELE